MYEALVVFVVATTGQGDEPDNMKVTGMVASQGGGTPNCDRGQNIVNSQPNISFDIFGQPSSEYLVIKPTIVST